MKELKDVKEPETKRKIIGRLFIEQFEKVVHQMGLDPANCMLLQGTLYPDVIESTSYKGPSTVIKTHHNVGGLPAKMKLTGREQTHCDTPILYTSRRFEKAATTRRSAR